LGRQGGNFRLWGPERFFSVVPNIECTYALYGKNLIPAAVLYQNLLLSSTTHRKMYPLWGRRTPLILSYLPAFLQILRKRLSSFLHGLLLLPLILKRRLHPKFRSNNFSIFSASDVSTHETLACWKIQRFSFCFSFSPFNCIGGFKSISCHNRAAKLWRNVEPSLFWFK